MLSARPPKPGVGRLGAPLGARASRPHSGAGETPALPARTRPPPFTREPTPPPSVLDHLDADQRAAAEILEGPLLIIAGPGTGKARTLIHRLAHLVLSGLADPEECLAITFTRRAVEEMRDRLEDLLSSAAHRLPAQTFHGLGLSILRAERAELGLHRGFRIAEDGERIALARELFDLSATRASRRITALGHARRERAAAGSVTDPALAEQLAIYEAALHERDLVDFDDLLALPAKLLSESVELRPAPLDDEEAVPWEPNWDRRRAARRRDDARGRGLAAGGDRRRRRSGPLVGSDQDGRGESASDPRRDCTYFLDHGGSGT